MTETDPPYFHYTNPDIPGTIPDIRSTHTPQAYPDIFPNPYRCVVTSVAENPALVCAWLDQMYAPLQSPQNNWGTFSLDIKFFLKFRRMIPESDQHLLKLIHRLGDFQPQKI